MHCGYQKTIVDVVWNVFAETEVFLLSASVEGGDFVCRREGFTQQQQQQEVRVS